MANYMLDAMQGYKFVNDINRQDRLDEERKTERAAEAEDRKVRLGIMQAGEGRAAQTHQLGLDALESEKAIARAKATPYIDEQPQAAQRPRDDVYAAWGENLTQMGVKVGTPEFSGAFAKVKPLLDDPAAAGEALALSDQINSYLDKGSLPPNDIMARYTNIVAAGELNQRGGDDGLVRNVKQFVPNQTGDGFHVNLLVQGKDGKTYEAPATEGKSADPKDSVVQNFTMDQVVKWYGGSRATLQMIIEAEAKAGKTTTIDAYRAAAQKYATDRQAKVEGIADYTKKKEIDQQYEKQAPVAIGKYGLYDPKTGQKIVGAAAGVGGVGGGKGKWIQDEDGEWQFLSSGDTAKGKGKQHVKQNEDGTTTIYDEGSGQSKTIYTPEAAMQRAQAMAQAEADAVGSEWASMQPSAAKTTARAQEIYKELMGSGAAPAGKPAAVAKYTPGQTLRQNGKTFVVDASGVPQEQGAKDVPPKKEKPVEKAPTNDQSNMTQEQKDAAGRARGGRGITPLPVPNKNLAGLNENNERVRREAAETKARNKAATTEKETSGAQKERARLEQIAPILREKMANGQLRGLKERNDYDKAIRLGLITAPPLTRRR